MPPFDAASWTQLHTDFVASGQPSLERWTLRYIHQPQQLDYVADQIAQYLNSIGQVVCVQIESVWIDGTPQAEYEACLGPSHACELGDILVVVDRFAQAGGQLSSVDSRALIMQAKIAPSPQAIPNGLSTGKQRLLLENSCSVAGIGLWKGTPWKSAQIGHYNIQNCCQGLTDHATYLLVPNVAIGFPVGFSPFTCAWTVPLPGNATQNIVEYVEALKQLSDVPVYGKLLNDPVVCEWSRMVHELLHGYQGVWMNGYGGQYRLNRSKVFCSGFGSGKAAFAAPSSGADKITPSAEMTMANLGLIEPDSAETSEGGGGNYGGEPPFLEREADGPQGPRMPVLRIGIIIHEQA